MFSYSYFQTLRDFLRPGRIVLVVVAAVLIFLIGRVWLGFSQGALADLSSGGSAPSVPSEVVYGQVFKSLVLRIVALAAAIFGMQVISAEIEQKTIVYQLTRALDRGKLLLSRSLAAMTATVIGATVCWLACGFSTMGGKALQTGPFWWDWLILVLGACAYTSLFVFVSLLLNKAMVYCLLFAFGWETVVPNMPGDLFRVSIYPYLTALSKSPEPEAKKSVLDVLQGQVTNMTVTSTVAWIVLPAVVVGLTVLGMLWIKAFEFAPREDAG